MWQSRRTADRRAAINALITATRADERAQWAAVKVALTKAFAKGRNMTDDEILAAADEIKERWMQAVHDKAQIVDNRIKALEQGNRNAAFGLADLRYAATYRCQCGVGMAYPLDCWVQGAWYCSSILLGTAEPGTTHDEPKPFVAWAIKSEGQPSARGATTRPTLAAPAVADTPAPQRAKGEG